MLALLPLAGWPSARSAYEGYIDFIFDLGIAYDRNGGLFFGDSPNDDLYPLNGLLAGSSVYLDHPDANTVEDLYLIGGLGAIIDGLDVSNLDLLQDYEWCLYVDGFYGGVLEYGEQNALGEFVVEDEDEIFDAFSYSKSLGVYPATDLPFDVFALETDGFYELLVALAYDLPIAGTFSDFTAGPDVEPGTKLHALLTKLGLLDDPEAAYYSLDVFEDYLLFLDFADTGPAPSDTYPDLVKANAGLTALISLEAKPISHVPEPSIYGLMGAAVLVAAIGLRRYQQRP